MSGAPATARTAPSGPRATVTAPATLGQYVLIVRITGVRNTTADFHFRILVA